MSQPEARLQQRIVKALKKAGYFALRQRLVGRAGWPDVYVILPGGRACHLEVKMPGKQPARLQLETLEELQGAGALTGVVRTPEEALCLANPTED